MVNAGLCPVVLGSQGLEAPGGSVGLWFPPVR